MEKYLIKYLLDNEPDSLRRKYIDYYKTEMDWFIYNYGEHMSKTHQRKQPHDLFGYFTRYCQYFKSLWTEPICDDKINILTKFSVPELGKTYRFYSSLLTPNGYDNIIGDFKTIKYREKKQNIINNGCIWDFLTPDFIKESEELKESLRKQFERYNFKGLFLHTDQYSETKMLIDIFKSMNIPSFIFVHGLPGPYSLDIDNRSDYLLVWGSRMKEHYVNAGFDPGKVIVIGNRKYTVFKEVTRNSFDDVLVIPPSAVLWHQYTWGNPVLIDRSAGILYLHQVEKVLRKMGIKKARYRVHPSLKKEWTDQFIDHDFYIIDHQPLGDSLAHATMVIGSASTVLFDALASGVNYIMYEPQENGKSILGDNLIPPFDGKDGILVGRNETELENMLKDRYRIPHENLQQYMQPFSVDKLIPLLG